MMGLSHLGRAVAFCVARSALCGCGDSVPVDTGSVPVCEEGSHPDAGACVPERCGQGRWGDVELDDDTVFVDAGAGAGGDGSAALPFVTIAEALQAAAGLGTTIVVARGSYRENLLLESQHDGIHMAGRCAELVTIDAGGVEGLSGVDVEMSQGSFQLSGLTVSGAGEAGLLVGGGQVEVRDVVFRDNAYTGAFVTQRGFAAASLLLERVVVEGNRIAGLAAAGARAELILREVVVSGTLPDEGEDYGYGLNVFNGASLEASELVLEDNLWEGLFLIGEGTQASVEGLTISGTALPDHPANSAHGIEAKDGAFLDLSGCTILGTDGPGLGVYTGSVVSMQGCVLDGNATSSVVVSGEGTRLTLSDTVVSGNRAAGYSDQLPTGVVVHKQASLEADGVELRDNLGFGFVVQGEGVSVTLRDVTVRDPLVDGEVPWATGIELSMGARAQLSGCHIEGARGVGMLAYGEGTELLVEGGAVVETGAGIGPLGGIAAGVVSMLDASVGLSGVEVAATAGPGLLALDGGGAVHCSACEIVDNQFGGVVAWNGGEARLEDSVISRSQQSANLGGGAGLYGGTPEGGPPSVLELSGSSVTDNPVAGVWLVSPGSYRLEGNTIAGSSGDPYGAGTRCGDAVLALGGVQAWTGSEGLLLTSNVLSGSVGAGLFLDSSAATLSGNRFEDNTLDLLVQGQGCGDLDTSAWGTSSVEICPEYTHPSCSQEITFELELSEVVELLPTALGALPVNPRPLATPPR